QAQKQNIEAETRLIDNLNQLRNSKIQLTEQNLILKDQLLETEYRLGELERTHKHYTELMKTPNTVISKEQFDATTAELTYLRGKRELLIERIKRETELQQQQSKQIDDSIERVNRNLALLTRIVDSLEVRAPIDGHLSTLSAEVGQRFASGQRVGQIDRPDGFKIRADIDQYYISRVAIGQKGKFEFGGQTYEVETTKIYPEVENDMFHADLAFIGAPPDGVKRGQTLNIDLGLSAPRRTTLVAKGSFYQHTSGRWAYLLGDDGLTAHRTPITLGRQNPQQVEVLEGLKPGDWIITSSYDQFGDAAELTFPKSLKP
ncbi:MAG TPA: HlyD family efflux transporter periplasmic adaptor subunit, partial [Polyangiales bacterium]